MMKLRRQFVGSIEEAAAEVKRLQDAGMRPAIEVTIVLEMEGFARVRERQKQKVPPKKRAPRQVAEEGVEIVN